MTEGTMKRHFRFSQLIPALLAVAALSAAPCFAEAVEVPADAVTCTGSAQGIDGDVVVEVVATADQIFSVTVTEQNETPGIGSVAVDTLPGEIVAAQSLQVEGISGATVTSSAIKDAVSAALESAGLDPSVFDVAPPEGEETTEGAVEDQVIDADVVIVGAGGAGMTAAIEAADAGRSVVIVESQAMVGGNSVRSTGGLNATKTPNQDENEFAEAAGVEKTLQTAADSWADNEVVTALAATVKEQWDAYQAAPEGYFDSTELMELDTMIGGKGLNDPELVHTLVANSADAITWLESIGAPCPSVGAFGGASVKRIHRPVNEEGKTVSVGAYIIPILQQNIEDRGVNLMLNTTATAILTDEEGKAVGVEAEGASGEKVTVNAKAVVLASGGEHLFSREDAVSLQEDGAVLRLVGRDCGANLLGDERHVGLRDAPEFHAFVADLRRLRGAAVRHRRNIPASWDANRVRWNTIRYRGGRERKVHVGCRADCRNARGWDGEGPNPHVFGAPRLRQECEITWVGMAFGMLEGI